MQKFYFIMKKLRVTQKAFSTYSHSGSLAHDYGGADIGSDAIYAPCDMIVKRVRLQANGEIYLQSVNYVQFADGTSNYASMILIHGDNRHLKAGQIIKQGEYITAEGGWGNGNPNMYAKHIHVEAFKGKFSSTTQAINQYGTYTIEKQNELQKMFILQQDCEILKNGEEWGGGYTWVQDKENENSVMFEENPIGSFMALYNINVRSASGTDYEVIGSFKENDTVEYYEEKGEWARVKIDGQNGWIKADPYAKAI